MSNSLPTSREFWAKAEDVFRQHDQHMGLCLAALKAAISYDPDARDTVEVWQLYYREIGRLRRYEPKDYDHTIRLFWWPEKPSDQPLDMPRLMVLRALQCEE